MFAPAEEVVQAVRNWLVSSGIEDNEIVHSDNKGWLAFDIPAWQAEDLFQTEYHEHEHSESGKVKIGCDEYVKSTGCGLQMLIYLSGTTFQSTFESISITLLRVSNSRLP
jgi:hypothetical protein